MVLLSRGGACTTSHNGRVYDPGSEWPFNAWQVGPVAVNVFAVPWQHYAGRTLPRMHPGINSMTSAAATRLTQLTHCGIVQAASFRAAARARAALQPRHVIWTTLWSLQVPVEWFDLALVARLALLGRRPTPLSLSRPAVALSHVLLSAP